MVGLACMFVRLFGGFCLFFWFVSGFLCVCFHLFVVVVFGDRLFWGFFCVFCWVFLLVWFFLVGWLVFGLGWGFFEGGFPLK